MERLRLLEERVDDLIDRVSRIQDYQATAFKVVGALVVTVVGQIIVILATRK